MGQMINRRRVITDYVDPFKDYNNLIFHLDGNDELTDGYWVDKVMGTKWIASGTPVHTDDGGWEVDYNNNFRITPSPNESGFYLPQYYKIEITFKWIDRNGWLVDLGSVAGAQVALGVLGRSSGYYTDNYKLLGNSNASKYGVFNNPKCPIINFGEKTTFLYGCVKKNVTEDIQVLQSKKKVIKSQNPHQPVTVPPGGWRLDNVFNNFWIGRAANRTIDYSGHGVIYDIKIYSK